MSTDPSMLNTNAAALLQEAKSVAPKGVLNIVQTAITDIPIICTAATLILTGIQEISKNLPVPEATALQAGTLVVLGIINKIEVIFGG